MAFSFFGCAVARPDIEACIINAPNGVRKCFNLAHDYQDNGALKPGAVPIYRTNTRVEDLNKALVIDSRTGFEDGLAGLKTYIKELRDHYANCKAAQ